MALNSHVRTSGMPTYNVSLSLTRPPSFGDGEFVELLWQAVKRAMCEAIEVAPAGMVGPTLLDPRQILPSSSRI